ncbi:MULTISPECIES: CBASS cGAMP-activated phospholipase [Alphaproteobacteria]|uniref:Patatin n=2 Tax=Alphaproteobacteria TaxID=28211 RepID=A0A512HJD6_9HYPH|nr:MULTISPECIES: CBASS cGAMP-activated phospholipase [Alphaproteobacteria]GEO85552.1 patatin [Ciceribacter naphthalenivorans]GLR22093.1 patatin [Ciceribacter naphthalenivorans]GLT04949.1 patatin [Sphingomonas psychrolutea]
MNYIPPRRSDGTTEHTRIKQQWPKDRPFRILSLDGGGIRGLFGAAYLAEIERKYLGGESIANYFDMVAGTSTGGIIALGLATGKSAAEISKIYSERGEFIFPDPKFGTGLWHRVRSFFRPKHQSSNLRDELLRVFGHEVLDSSTCRAVVPCFEGTHGEPFIYKTPHHPDYKKDRHKALVDIALHTSAAPSYMSAVYSHGHLMLDGGIWANNPIMNALVDALACYDVPRENIRILSIGTGEETVTLAKRHFEGGKLAWGLSSTVPLLFRLSARAQNKNALGQAYLLAGKPNILRVDLDERDEHMGLDDVRRAKKELPSMARSQAEANGILVKQMFLETPADPYVRCPV